MDVVLFTLPCILHSFKKY